MAILLLLALAVTAGAAGLAWKQYQLGKREIPFLMPRFDPSRQYELSYWDYHLPGTAGQQWVTEMLAEFQQRYPNVTVHHRLLHYLDGEVTLQAALREGAFPDVYAGPPAPFLVDSGLLASPLPYLRPDEKSAYPSNLWPAQPAPPFGWLKRREAPVGPIGFPRWVIPKLWAADAQALRQAGIDPAAVVAGGWTWTEFFAAAERGGPRFFASETPLALLQQILAGYGVPDAFAADGTPVWTGELAATGAQVLARLRPKRPVADGMLDALFTGRSGVIGQVGLWLLPLTQGRSRSVVLLPPPYPSGERPIYRTDLHLVFVLSATARRERLPAAMELARFLSQHAAAVPSERAGAIPLYAPARRDWLGAGKQSLAALVEHYLAHATTPPVLPAEVAERQQGLLQVVGEATDRFWRGEIGAEEFAQVLVPGTAEP